jgi:tol-pal system protein YbgF
MQIFVRLILIPAFALCSVVYSLGALAQVRVVDAGSSQENQQKVPASNNSQNDIMVNMYLQLESLQSEIQNLRGLVEEQSYQIKRMQTEQRDRYLDTDSRLSEINSQVQSYHSGQPIAGISPAPSVINPLTNSSANTNGSSNLTANNQPLTNPVAGGAGVAVASPQTEQQLYREALNLLLEDEAFTESINLFQQYIERYPRGRYLTNTLYWQGAAMELAGLHAQAILVLQRLISEFPADAKAPTALLRLGTVYRKMGENAQAASQWRRIAQDYPESVSEIEIANEYLSEISN